MTVRGSVKVNVVDCLNLRAAVVHCLVLHLTQRRSHVALHVRTCSSWPPMHSAEHLVQVDDPLTLENVCPSTHGVQLVLMDAIVDRVPTGQGVHCSKDEKVKVPAGHAMHPVMPSLSANVPGLHVWHFTDALEEENVPFGHSLHCSRASASE